MKNLKMLALNRYKNLKIKYKLIVFILILLLVCLSFIIIGFQYAFNTYDEQIYRKSSQVLIMSSNRIEDELKNIEEVTYKVATDSVIQDALTDSYESLSKYEKFRIEQEIWEKLTSYIGSENYIQSIHLFNRDGKEFRAGRAPSKNLYNHKGTLIKTAENGSGGNVWMSLEGSNNTIFSTREIRSYKRLRFENLGSLIVEVRLHEIVDELSSEREGEGFIAMSKGDDMFFVEDPTIDLSAIDLSADDPQGYKIQQMLGRSNFVTYSKSPYMDWTYWSVIPFDTMFAKVTMIKYMVIFLFLAIMISAIYLVVRFSKRITNPIENLVSAMKYVERGDFKVADTFTPSQYHDEVGILHQNFIQMIERINDLIKENYEKQLLLKDTEFKALQSQINPHFLYNALESINWLAKINQQQQISQMVESLGFLLRNAISIQDDVITVREEVKMVEHYVTIQRYRFEERLEFSLSVDEEVKDCVLPKLVIQPLVENAIIYGLERMIEPCNIHVSVLKEGDYLQLAVEDNGPGMDKEQLDKVRKGEMKTRGTGIGLRNIDSRIKFVFGSEYGLQIDSELNKGTKVSITIPYQKRWDYVQSTIGR
ncbi:cache domain-containing sensor histidine kinase [Litchfieldia alkalitelluris]|uniref:cache domain-containing sensor histidine kinase n=1 Tax=Litchfieldia alkalitelluris TaxID=304268 RepID=UPI001F38B053|nr:sensor histidine kinase [Litchfieldia alkalitelluris]